MKQVYIVLGDGMSAALHRLAREISVKEDRDISVQDLIRRAIKAQYHLTENGQKPSKSRNKKKK